MAVESTNLDYLEDDLRIQVGDYTEPYTYEDSHLYTTLVASVKALMPYWDNKYLINTTTNDVYRNPSSTFVLPEPPIVQISDERPIILMASVIIKGGTLENSAWSLGAWKDHEISFSNIQGSKTREGSLERDWMELMRILGDPRQRLAQAIKGNLRGYKKNDIETGSKY